MSALWFWELWQRAKETGEEVLWWGPVEGRGMEWAIIVVVGSLVGLATVSAIKGYSPTWFELLGAFIASFPFISRRLIRFALLTPKRCFFVVTLWQWHWVSERPLRLRMLFALSPKGMPPRGYLGLVFWDGLYLVLRFPFPSAAEAFLNRLSKMMGISIRGRQRFFFRI